MVEYFLTWNCLMIRFKLWIFGRNIAKLILSSSPQYFKFINSFIYSVWTSVDPIQWIFNSNTYICFFFFNLYFSPEWLHLLIHSINPFLQSINMLNLVKIIFYQFPWLGYVWVCFCSTLSTLDYELYFPLIFIIILHQFIQCV